MFRNEFVSSVGIDDNREAERNAKIPWSSDPAGSYAYYECCIEVMLDSGIVVHNRLPTVNGTPDTLASALIDDANLDRIVNTGVNLRSSDQYVDIVQRMGHSRYWFRLWGQAIRIGYQVPIPGIRYIGGALAIPYDKNPQWAFNRIAPGGNYGGVVVWHARWSLWYTVATPPSANPLPAVDLAARVSNQTPLPGTDGLQAPWSRADDRQLQRRLGNTTIVG